MAKKQSILPIIIKALPLLIPVAKWLFQHRKMLAKSKGRKK